MYCSERRSRTLNELVRKLFFRQQQLVFFVICLAMPKRAASSSSGLPRGGIRQKSEWTKAEQGPPPAPGQLATLLLHKRAWGHLPAVAVQELAAAAVADGAQCPHLSKLAKIGSSGRCPGNCERDLQANLRPNVFNAALQHICMPMLSPMQIVRGDQSILYPHVLFSILFTTHPDVFMDRMCGGSEDNVERFWADMRGHPSLEGHPMLDKPDYKKRCVPLHMHGDGVSVAGVGKAWSKSVEVYSWGSCLSRGSTLMKTFLIFIAHKLLISKIAGSETMTVFWRHFCWSMNILFAGVWPPADADNVPYAIGTPDHEKIGKPIAGGWCGAYLSLEHTGSKTPCFLCKANTDEFPWTDCRQGTAKWLTTLWSNRRWQEARPNRHVIFRAIPGVSLSSILPDLMHSKHLGSDAYFYGSVLKMLTHTMLPDSHAANLATVSEQIMEQYKAAKTIAKNKK